MIKLSIITINRNNAEGLKRTLDSVKAQTCQEFEHIIIDGASTDDSVNIIESYVRDVSRMKYDVLWMSEPDTGIYNAMNKGLKMVHGEYTLMLNSGDYLVDEHVIERIMPELDGTDIIQGNNIEEKETSIFRDRGYGKSKIDLFDVLKGHFLHQASFCRRDLFERYGYFDESYKSSGDTKFFMSCLGRHDAAFKYIDIDITNYDLTGISAAQSEKWRKCREEEYNRIIKEVFSKRIYSFMQDNDKKVRLYNELHTHKWIWFLVMAVAHLNNIFYRHSADAKIDYV